LLDEARELLPPIVEAMMALAKAKSRFDSLRAFLLDRADAAKDVSLRNGFYHDLEALDKEARDSFAVGPMLAFSGGDEWRDLARELGDVPHRPTHTTTLDPVVAAAAAFETKW
jgi:hypothetical protein